MAAHRPLRPASTARGFTLIELAVVLFILALLLGGLLGPLAVRRDQADRQNTEKALAEIKDALLGYVVVNGRFPCPDITAPPDGVEDRTAPDCDAPVTNGLLHGNLPYADLGVEANDAWRSPFRYHVTEGFADNDDGTGGACAAAPAGVSFQLCSNGAATILDGAAGANLVTGAVVVVVSSGANAGTPYASLSAHEQENHADDEGESAPAPNEFVLKSFSRETTSEFDDLLIWIAPNILMNRMIVSERLP